MLLKPGPKANLHTDIRTRVVSISTNADLSGKKTVKSEALEGLLMEYKQFEELEIVYVRNYLSPGGGGLVPSISLSKSIIP